MCVDYAIHDTGKGNPHELDEDLCSMLTDSGVLLAGVHRLLMHEGYCHE